MGPDHGADEVVGLLRVSDPVANRFVDGGSQSSISAIDRHDLGPEPDHSIDVRPLTLHVHGTHVDATRKSYTSRGGGRGDPVLTGTGLGHESSCAHFPCQQCLANGVVDLVCARMSEILPLQPEIDAPPLTERSGSCERCGSSDPVAKLAVESALEAGVVEPTIDALLETSYCFHECLRDETAAKVTEPSRCVRSLVGDAIAAAGLIGIHCTLSP